MALSRKAPFLPKGTRIKVGDNLRVSYSRYGPCSSGVMDRMKGGIFSLVKDSEDDEICLRSKEISYVYHFSRHDISILSTKKHKRQKPVTFNLDKLDV